VATLWGALKYVPENYATTQPFLIAFFAIYVLIGLFYALRHAGDGKRVLDGIVIFGTPIVSFLLQTQLVEHFEYGAAISAIAASAVSLLLALFVRSRATTASGNVAQWLKMSYAALALIFATLAVPLAVDGRMTAAIWAIEGAGVFWLATRQKSLIGQLFGCLVWPCNCSPPARSSTVSRWWVRRAPMHCPLPMRTSSGTRCWHWVAC